MCAVKRSRFFDERMYCEGLKYDESFCRINKTEAWRVASKAKSVFEFKDMRQRFKKRLGWGY